LHPLLVATHISRSIAIERWESSIHLFQS